MIPSPFLSTKRWSSKEGLEGDLILINAPDQVGWQDPSLEKLDYTFSIIIAKWL